MTFPQPPREFRSSWKRGLLSCWLLLCGAAAAAQSASPADKLAPALQNLAARGSKSPAQTVRVSSAQPAALREWAARELPQARFRPLTPEVLEVSGLSAAQLPALAASPFLTFVDVARRPGREERLISFNDLSANRASVVHQQLPQLSGAGLTVSVKENAFDPADIDFKGRVLAAPSGAPVSPHATIMATIVAGAGNSGPTGKGVAWQARLTPASFASFLPDDGQALTQAGVSVQNHSYGSSAGIENWYGLEAREYDRHTRLFPGLLHVFSAGNSGTDTSPSGPYAAVPGFANLTGQFKMAKNVLSVGATDALGQVAARSSRGPAYDGRVKPELVAYGDGGTSEAAAMVSGIALLVQQAYRDGHGGALPTAALVKAALLNSADDAGRPEVDFATGFGRADALGAVQTIREGRFAAGSSSPGATQTFPLTVPAGMRQLKVTLVWPDAEAAANAPRALVNDLDLELVQPATGRRWRPWVLSSYPHADSLQLPARRRADHLNNVEQVTLALPDAGSYEVQVRGFDVPVGPQAFSLAYEWEATGLSWTRPQAGDDLRPEERNTLRWQWRGPAATGRLEYRPVGSTAWQLVEAAVNLADEQWAWTPPAAEQVAELRLSVGSSAWTSEKFTLTRRPLPQVGYACPEEVLLYWPRTTGATQYQLYRVGATHLEPLALTADTVLVIDRRQQPETYVAVAPILQGLEGSRSYTVGYNEQETSCYVKSFQPRQLVNDTAVFDLELGSTFRLQSATLERRSGAGFVPVQTVAPVTQLRLSLADRLPASGRYEYRVRLETTDGRQYYSQTEPIFQALAGDVLVFPNPVPSGQLLNIVTTESDGVELSIYDLRGRLLRRSTEASAIISLNPAGLPQGTYLVHVRTPRGQTTVRRIVVL
ncbi:S8 family serine peptidase [Hymenobacter sp. B81]|uniref:S8 family serine peptidase n=1 Tax=Hymenobacter sp. B81 TaxID=3344878 RepID=UPI0037DD0629